MPYRPVQARTINYNGTVVYRYAPAKTRSYGHTTRRTDKARKSPCYLISNIR